MIIDVHSHIFPDEYVRRVEKLGGRIPQFEAAPLSQLSIAERLESMDEHGVDIGVLSVGVLQPYHADRNTSADLARQANELFLAAGAESAGRLMTFAALPLPHLDLAVRELDRLSGVDGVAGISIGTSVLDHELDDEALFPLYEELDGRGCTVFVHPSMTFAGFGPRDLGMTRTIGAMFEDTIAATRLLLSGICVRYPRINFIIPHLGGTLPFIHGRLSRHLQRCEREWVAAGLTSEDAPNTGMARLWYDTAVRHAPALACARETIGSERLLFGTDFPYLKSKEELGVRLRDIRDLDLPEPEQSAVLGDRAAALIGIKPQ